MRCRAALALTGAFTAQLGLGRNRQSTSRFEVRTLRTSRAQTAPYTTNCGSHPVQSSRRALWFGSRWELPENGIAHVTSPGRGLEDMIAHKWRGVNSMVKSMWRGAQDREVRRVHGTESWPALRRCASRRRFHSGSEHAGSATASLSHGPACPLRPAKIFDSGRTSDRMIECIGPFPDSSRILAGICTKGRSAV